MNNHKKLYTRVTLPNLTLTDTYTDVDGEEKSISDMILERGEIVICRDNAQGNWGIKIGNGCSKLGDLKYLYNKEEISQIIEDYEYVPVFVNKAQKHLDLTMRVVAELPDTIQPSTIYFVYET